jgi:NAD(P)-dependent dehydrogenase (short-subunit alcohol dehydrogenase family)
MEKATGSNSKIVLISGTSSGFGQAIAKLLANNGYRVFGTSRNPSKAASSSELLQLDVTSDDSVRSCIHTLLDKTGGKLDVLINNAGIVTTGAIEETTVDDAHLQLETNLVGALRMVRATLPVMRRQHSGQIINIGSFGGHIAVPFEGFYATTKFALEGFTEQLRAETKNLGIKVSILEPGFFKTNLFSASKPSTDSIPDYKASEDRVISALHDFDLKGEDPIKVAELILRIIQSEKPKLRYAIGKNKSGLLFKRLLPDSIFEGQVRRIFRVDG